MTETRGGPSRLGPRTVAASALGAFLALATSGCSFLAPPPPGSVSDAVKQTVAELRGTAGVASVTTTVSPYDFKDGGPLSNPGAWLASITIEAKPDAADLPVLADAAADSIDELAGTVPVTARLELSVGARAVFTRLTLPVEGGAGGATPAGQLVGTAEQLASIDSVASIFLGSPYDETAITTDAAVDVPAVASSVRQLPNFGSGDLAVVTVSASSPDTAPISSGVTMDAASPSPALLTFFERLAGQAGVASVNFNGVQGPDELNSAEGWRPTLEVRVDDEPTEASVVAELEAFAEPQAMDDDVPRAGFLVTHFTEQRGTTAVGGFIGLPTGSADPGDGLNPVPPAGPSASPTSPPAPETPEEQDARLAADQVVVAEFLDAAGDLAGIRGTSTIQTMVCEANGVPTGRQVTGSVVIPIFEVADSGEGAYADITSSWAKAGLGSGEKAMGREYFMATSKSAVVQRASIRVKEEGVSLIVEGRCSGD
jgi:hypothetical protein